MDNHKELLARIDERTANIERRQLEEIGRFDRLTDRVGTLESWRNFLGGAWAVATVIFGILFYEVKDAFSRKHY